MKIDITTKAQAKKMIKDLFDAEKEKIYEQLDKIRTKIIELEETLKVEENGRNNNKR